MPLIKKKSKKAFDENVAKEMEAGKPQKQSLAIAFNTQKHAAPKKKMALGGAVEGETHSKPKYDRDPGAQAPKPDDRRLEKNDYMADDWAGGPDPVRKPDDQRRPINAYLNTNDWSDGEKPSRKPFAEGGEVLTSKPNAPRPSQESTESAALNSRAPRGQMSHAQMAEYHEQEAAKYRMYADGGVIAPDSRAQETQYPGTKARMPDDERPANSDYMSGEFDNGPAPMRKPDDERLSEDKYMSDYNYSQGGEVDEPDSMDQPEPEADEEKEASITAAIMARKRGKKMMAEGGMVDLEANSEEQPNNEDQYSFNAVKKEQYDLSQLSKQPMDSNETGDDREDGEENDHDKNIVGSIRRKMKSKRM